jgi:hypothetical protein
MSVSYDTAHAIEERPEIDPAHRLRRTRRTEALRS